MLLCLSSQQLQPYFDCIIYSHSDHIPTGFVLIHWRQHAADLL